MPSSQQETAESPMLLTLAVSEFITIIFVGIAKNIFILIEAFST